jgi:hypothetical protein
MSTDSSQTELVSHVALTPKSSFVARLSLSLTIVLFLCHLYSLGVSGLGVSSAVGESAVAWVVSTVICSAIWVAFYPFYPNWKWSNGFFRITNFILILQLLLLGLSASNLLDPIVAARLKAQESSVPLAGVSVEARPKVRCRALPCK